MKMEKIGLLAVDSSRTRAYLHALKREKLLPAHVIFLSNSSGEAKPDRPVIPYFDDRTPALEIIHALGLPLSIIDTGDINNLEVVSSVRDSPAEILIYSGPGGGILKKDLLNSGKKFLHIHAGWLPEYRGSTTVYYSLLSEGNCGVSAIFLEEKIDTGPILARGKYPPPNDRKLLDYGYDPYIRSDLLVKVLDKYLRSGKFDKIIQSEIEGETFYIMHPVLKHLTILRGSHAE